MARATGPRWALGVVAGVLALSACSGAARDYPPAATQTLREIALSEYTVRYGWEGEPAHRSFVTYVDGAGRKFEREIPLGLNPHFMATDGTIVATFSEPGGDPTETFLLTPRGETVRVGWGYPMALGPGGMIWFLPDSNQAPGNDHVVRVLTTSGRVVRDFEMPADVWPIHAVWGGAVVELSGSVYFLDLATGLRHHLGFGHLEGAVLDRFLWTTCDPAFSCSRHWNLIKEPAKEVGGPSAA